MLSGFSSSVTHVIAGEITDMSPMIFITLPWVSVQGLMALNQQFMDMLRIVGVPL